MLESLPDATCAQHWRTNQTCCAAAGAGAAAHTCSLRARPSVVLGAPRRLREKALSRELPSFSRSPSATGRRRQIAGHRWPAAPVNDRLYSRLVAGSRPQEGKRASSWPLRGHCVGNESPGSQLLMNTNCASRRTLMNSASIARSLARTKPSSSDTHVKLPRSLARNVIVVNGDHASRLAR